MEVTISCLHGKYVVEIRTETILTSGLEFLMDQTNL